MEKYIKLHIEKLPEEYCFVKLTNLNTYALKHITHISPCPNPIFH